MLVAKLLLPALGALLLLGTGCMSGGTGGAEETTVTDGTTAVVSQSMCRKVCGMRCRRTRFGTQCQQECWTQCR